MSTNAPDRERRPPHTQHDHSPESPPPGPPSRPCRLSSPVGSVSARPPHPARTVPVTLGTPLRVGSSPRYVRDSGSSRPPPIWPSLTGSSPRSGGTGVGQRGGVVRRKDERPQCLCTNFRVPRRSRCVVSRLTLSPFPNTGGTEGPSWRECQTPTAPPVKGVYPLDLHGSNVPLSRPVCSGPSPGPL